MDAELAYGLWRHEKQLEESALDSLCDAAMELNDNQFEALLKAWENPRRKAALLAKVNEVKTAGKNLTEEKDAIVRILKENHLEMAVASVVCVPENAHLSNGAPPRVTIPPVKQEQPWYFGFGKIKTAFGMVAHYMQRRNEDDTQLNCVNEPDKHIIELGPLGAAETHPVIAIGNSTGNLASGGVGSLAPDTSITIGDSNSGGIGISFPIYDSSESDGDSNSGGIGISFPIYNSSDSDGGSTGGSIGLSFPIYDSSDSDGDSNIGGIGIRFQIGDPSDSDGDSNSRGTGNSGGACSDLNTGYLYLFMGMTAEVVPSLMQLAGSAHKPSLQVLLWGINLSAAGCFLCSSCGLSGVVMRTVDCRLFSPSTLQKVQKFSLIGASTFMTAAMTMVFGYISVAMV